MFLLSSLHTFPIFLAGDCYCVDTLTLYVLFITRLFYSLFLSLHLGPLKPETSPLWVSSLLIFPHNLVAAMLLVFNI